MALVRDALIGISFLFTFNMVLSTTKDLIAEIRNTLLRYFGDILIVTSVIIICYLLIKKEKIGMAIAVLGLFLISLNITLIEYGKYEEIVEEGRCWFFNYVTFTNHYGKSIEIFIGSSRLVRIEGMAYQIVGKPGYIFTDYSIRILKGYSVIPASICNLIYLFLAGILVFIDFAEYEYKQKIFSYFEWLLGNCRFFGSQFILDIIAIVFRIRNNNNIQVDTIRNNNNIQADTNNDQ